MLKTRLATIALYLGDTSIAAGMLKGGPEPGETAFDPVQRTMFIEWFPDWPGSVENLVELIDGASDPCLRSGFCLAVGSIEEPSVDAKGAWHKTWSNWYANQPDSGIHGASKWSLQAWGLRAPVIPAKRLTHPTFNWRVT